MSVQARQLFTDAKERAKPSLYGGAGRLPTRPKLRMLSSAPLEGLDGSEPDIPRTIHIGWRPRGTRRSSAFWRNAQSSMLRSCIAGAPSHA
jgi:hypothetical protein